MQCLLGPGWLCKSFPGSDGAFAPIQPPLPYKTWLAQNSPTNLKKPESSRNLNVLYLSPLAIIYIIFKLI